jgi:hypothetical protein
VVRYCGLNRTTVRELDPSRCGVRAGKNVKWVANKLPWEGVWVFKPYHFFQKNPGKGFGFSNPITFSKKAMLT